MTTTILNKRQTEFATYFEVACGKVSALITYRNTGHVGVCVRNASHRVWKKLGRYHPNFELALASYKSAAVRDMIETVKAEVAS